MAVVLGGAVLSSQQRLTLCEEASALPLPKFTPSSVAKEDLESMVEQHNVEDLPVLTSEEVAQRDGSNGTPVWMSYGGIVYDVTQFIANHPGGSDKIIQAAGSAIEPFWYIYRQHYNSDLPMRLMEHMAIGRLREEDQQDIDEQMLVLEQDDPYAREPARNKLLRVHTDAPMNAEVPTQVLSEHYITPNDLFYIRNHHPVPYLTEKQLQDFRLKVDLSGYNGDLGVVSFSLEELKRMPKTELVVTLQCSGNRRGGFNAYQRTSGTPWGMCCLFFESHTFVISKSNCALCIPSFVNRPGCRVDCEIYRRSSTRLVDCRRCH
jgi:sulfite oxidase